MTLDKTQQNALTQKILEALTPAQLENLLPRQEQLVGDGISDLLKNHSVDEVTPMIGYLPGQMPWQLNEKLINLGVVIVNIKSDKTTCVDRKLLTGASPLAANELGKLAANTLLKALS